jgi:hypothetical protein
VQTPQPAGSSAYLHASTTGTVHDVLIAGMLAVGLVIGIAAILVIREAGRIADEPPPALFDPDDAFEFERGPRATRDRSQRDWRSGGRAR